MLQRRTFLVASAGLLLLPFPGRARAKALAGDTVSALEGSEFVYISPLKSNGEESRCHGEVWYGWLDDQVVITTSTGTWKARAHEKGLDSARIWVGNYGRGGTAFRKGPHFDAKATVIQDKDVLERLMQTFRKKYPDEIGKWEGKMRKGFETGERVLLGYKPN